MADEGEEGGPNVGLGWHAADNVGEWMSGRVGVWACGRVGEFHPAAIFSGSTNKATMKDP